MIACYLCSSLCMERKPPTFHFSHTNYKIPPKWSAVLARVNHVHRGQTLNHQTCSAWVFGEANNDNSFISILFKQPVTGILLSLSYVFFLFSQLLSQVLCFRSLQKLSCDIVSQNEVLGEQWTVCVFLVNDMWCTVSVDCQLQATSQQYCLLLPWA